MPENSVLHPVSDSLQYAESRSGVCPPKIGGRCERRVFSVAHDNGGEVQCTRLDEVRQNGEALIVLIASSRIIVLIVAYVHGEHDLNRVQ